MKTTASNEEMENGGNTPSKKESYLERVRREAGDWPSPIYERRSVFELEKEIREQMEKIREWDKERYELLKKIFDNKFL